MNVALTLDNLSNEGNNRAVSKNFIIIRTNLFFSGVYSTNSKSSKFNYPNDKLNANRTESAGVFSSIHDKTGEINHIWHGFLGIIVIHVKSLLILNAASFHWTERVFGAAQLLSTLIHEIRSNINSSSSSSRKNSIELSRKIVEINSFLFAVNSIPKNAFHFSTMPKCTCDRMLGTSA